MGPKILVATSFCARRARWMLPRRSIHGSLRLACALRHKLPSGEQIGIVSVGVRNLALALACPAFRGVAFPDRLHWLHYPSEARSIASWAGMLFDLRRHIDLSVPRTCSRHFHNRSRPRTARVRHWSRRGAPASLGISRSHPACRRCSILLTPIRSATCLAHQRA